MGLGNMLFGRMIDKRIAAYQNDLVSRHLDEVQNIYSTMRGWRHDYHNHIQTLIALSSDAVKTKDYLLKLNDDLKQIDTVIKTGNIMIDAILNSKLSLIKSKGIAAAAKAVVPKTLNISEIDLCVIIGNLLDNAMESCQKGAGDMWIRVFIGILKGQLYISVSNSVSGEVKKSGGSYLSTKGGGHGFGLMRVDRIAKKYSGYVNRQNEEGVFATEVMLPM